MLSAGVARKDGGFGPEFDHMALHVKLEESWLADVGFGDGFVDPLLLENHSEQNQPCGAFRIESDGMQRILSRSTRGGAWEPQYRFTLKPHQLGDYREMCHYHQSSPLTSFTQGRIVTLATPHGRVTVSRMHLITTDFDGSRRERELSTEAEYRQILEDLFGIRLVDETRQS
jgi:N-hydroxyarylamine O-acetyltransferase